MVKVGREDFCHVDEELSPVAEEVCEEEWVMRKMMLQIWKKSRDLNACGVMENMSQMKIQKS